MKRAIRLLGLLAVVSTGAMAGCMGTGTTTAYVGVYGPPVYGGGAWGGYPYPGRYPPYGGGVWVGVPVCCDEQEQQEEQEQQPEPGQPEAEKSEPTITNQEKFGG